MNVAVLVFARAPVPGEVKTRLAPVLGVEGAARLYARMLERAVATAVAAGTGPVTLCCTPSTDHPLLRALARRRGCTLAGQTQGDLGLRMHASLCTALAVHPAALLMGSDCPALEAQDLRAAAAALLAPGGDVVLVPATDGGYVLVGQRAPCAAMFRGLPWGSTGVLAATRERLAAAGRSWLELPPRADIDTPADLALLPPGWR